MGKEARARSMARVEKVGTRRERDDDDARDEDERYEVVSSIACDLVGFIPNHGGGVLRVRRSRI